MISVIAVNFAVRGLLAVLTAIPKARLEAA